MWPNYGTDTAMYRWLRKMNALCPPRDSGPQALFLGPKKYLLL
jgi:hypothetical protein